MPLDELLDKVKNTENIDFLRETVEWMANELMQLDVAQRIGARNYERSENRSNSRNGYRHVNWTTRAGEVDLAVPKLRQGSYYPDFLLERHNLTEEALLATVVEAYVNGVSTRKMDKLFKSLGADGIDKSQVSRITKQLNERIAEFRNRPLDKNYVYVWLDATFPKFRENHRVISGAMVVAIGVTAKGQREVLGFELGASESGPFWLSFLRSLKTRGLQGVKLVISDAHEGLKGAIEAVFSGTEWQRCTVHFMRNVLSQVPKSGQELVVDLIRSIYAQPNYKAAIDQFERILPGLAKSYPKAAEILENGIYDSLTYMAFPKEHWKRIHSTNPLERVNREIKRRINSVGIFPDRDSVTRLVGAVLIQQHEDWISGRNYFSDTSMAKLKQLSQVNNYADKPELLNIVSK